MWVFETRRRRWTVAIAAAAFVVYTLAGFFLVPRIIRAQIRDQAKTLLNRDARADDVRFNPFTLAATVSGLTIADRDETALLTVDRLRVDFQLSGIFRRAFRFR